VTPTIVDQAGKQVDPSTISSIVVKSDTGEVINLDPTKSTLLDVSRPAIRRGVLTSLPVSYSLQSIIVRGANVVDGGRQTFKASGPVEFVAQYRDLTFTGHDALFGKKMGTEAVVTFPDGSQQIVPFNAQHVGTLPHVPRGTYTVKVKAGHSIAAISQFAASKDKNIDVAVISMFDLALLAGAGLLVAIALLLIGRNQWRRWIVRRFRRSLDTSPPMASVKEDALL
jgi:hypothetical protein